MFGRGTSNDFCFEPEAFRKNPNYQAISTKHFKLYRVSKIYKTAKPLLIIHPWRMSKWLVNRLAGLGIGIVETLIDFNIIKSP